MSRFLITQEGEDMPCRVGITTDKETRKTYWKGQVEGFSGWRILANYSTRNEAQAHEDRYAKQNKCQAAGGGGTAPGTWHVYRFDYTRTK